MSAKEFVLHSIQKKYTVTGDVDIMKMNYIESGYIDSMGLIKFMVDIEDEFGIEFTDDEIVGPDFRVVGGLIALIEKKVSALA